MAGLIQEQMPAPGASPAPQKAAPPQDAAPQMPPQAEEDTGSGPDPDTDPGYQTAMQFAMEALYKNGAADQVAESLRGNENPVDALANTAYEIISIVEERTEGAVPDELLVLFATKILEEVADIADAAGVKLKPSDVALALKQMILRYLGEQGVDTTQLAAAMDQADPEEFNRMAAEEQ